jgi:predicted phosphoribosyltransferase
MPLAQWTRSFCANDAFASELRGHVVVLVADGIASADRAAAAIARARAGEAARVVLAAPVASLLAARYLAGRADDLVVLATPRPFHSVRFWYDEFAVAALERPRTRRRSRTRNGKT